jgi:hypothetical protein
VSFYIGPVAYPGILYGGGVQQIQLRTESREKTDLGAAAPYSGVLLNFQISETPIFIRLLQMYFPWNWEIGSALSNLQNFWGGVVLNPPSVRHCI